MFFIFGIFGLVRAVDKENPAFEKIIIDSQIKLNVKISLALNPSDPINMGKSNFTFEILPSAFWVIEQKGSIASFPPQVKIEPSDADQQNIYFSQKNDDGTERVSSTQVHVNTRDGKSLGNFDVRVWKLSEKTLKITLNSYDPEITTRNYQANN